MLLRDQEALKRIQSPCQFLSVGHQQGWAVSIPKPRNKAQPKHIWEIFLIHETVDNMRSPHVQALPSEVSFTPQNGAPDKLEMAALVFPDELISIPIAWDERDFWRQMFFFVNGILPKDNNYRSKGMNAGMTDVCEHLWSQKHVECQHLVWSC